MFDSNNIDVNFAEDDVIARFEFETDIGGKTIVIDELTKCTIVEETVDGYVIQIDDTGEEFKVSEETFELIFVRLG